MDEFSKACELTDFPVVIRVPILWGDQDAFGHVNNTVPIRWFESARIAYLEQSGVGAAMSERGLDPILASVRSDYRRQLKYPDYVQLGARVTRLGNSSVTMQHAVYSEDQQAVAVEGQAVFVVFDYKENASCPVPDEARAAVEKIEGKTF